MFAMASCVSRARLDGHPRSSMGTSTPHAWTIRVRPGVPRSDEDGALGEEKSLHLHSKEDFKSSIIRSELGVGAAERVARRLRSLVYRNSAGHPRRSAIRDGGSGRRSDLPPAPYQPGHVRVRLRARAAPLLRGCRGGCRAPERAQDSRTPAGQADEDSPEHQCGVFVSVALSTAPPEDAPLARSRARAIADERFQNPLFPQVEHVAAAEYASDGTRASRRARETRAGPVPRHGCVPHLPH